MCLGMGLSLTKQPEALENQLSPIIAHQLPVELGKSRPWSVHQTLTVAHAEVGSGYARLHKYEKHNSLTDPTHKWKLLEQAPALRGVASLQIGVASTKEAWLLTICSLSSVLSSRTCSMQCRH